MDTVLALVAPSLFAASVYMELGRIVELIQGDHYLFIRRTWLTKIFVTGDVISFLIQGGGMYQYYKSLLQLSNLMQVVGYWHPTTPRRVTLDPTLSLPASSSRSSSLASSSSLPPCSILG